MWRLFFDFAIITLALMHGGTVPLRIQWIDPKHKTKPERG